MICLSGGCVLILFSISKDCFSYTTRIPRRDESRLRNLVFLTTFFILISRDGIVILFTWKPHSPSFANNLSLWESLLYLHQKQPFRLSLC